MIGKLICLFKGHLRGEIVRVYGGYNIFVCPRCGHEKKYKHRLSVVPIQKAEAP